MYQDHRKAEELTGKTIAWSGLIKPEWGRSDNGYLLLKFTDGTRQIVGIRAFFFTNPDPTIEEMQKAPEFFTEEEVIAKFADIERKRRNYAAEQLHKKREQYEQLRKELGND